MSAPIQAIARLLHVFFEIYPLVSYITDVSYSFKSGVTCGLVVCIGLSLCFLEAKSQCSASQELVTVEITTDDFGNETTWEIYDENNSIVYAGGPYASNTSFTHTLCVDTGKCYRFIIHDAFGDGICCFYGFGSYTIYYGQNAIGTGGIFATSETEYIGSCSIEPLITDNTTYTKEQLVQDVLLGSCVEAFNVVYTGAAQATGYFHNGSGIGMERGLLLTTGNTNIAPGPNSIDNAGIGSGASGDPILEAVTGVSPTYNASSLEFDFVSFNDTVTFRYIFASEEYNEFVCSEYNDVFAFLVTGTGYAPNTNIALVPGSSTPVAINTVNNGTPGDFTGIPYDCSTLSTPNSLTNTAYFIDNTAGVTTEFDGYTVPLTATMVVVPCDTYHIKLVIADVLDDIYDSGVFLEAESFTGGQSIDIKAVTLDGTKNAFEGCYDGSFTFFRQDSTNISDSVVVNFTLTGSATEGADFQSIPHSVVIPANQYSASVTIEIILDTIFEGFENIIVSYQDGCSCNNYKRDTLYIFDNLELTGGIVGPDTICIGQQATLTAYADGSFSRPFRYSWSTSDTSRPITVSPLTTTTYTVTITDFCRGQTVTASHQLNVAPEVIADFTFDSPQCLPANDFDFINTSTYTGSPIFYWNLGDSNTASTQDVSNYAYSASGTYTVLLRITVNGCSDSIAQDVTVLDAAMTTITAAICPDSFIFAGGANQNTAGIYYDTLTAANGCDSVIATDLTVIPYPVMNQLAVICEDDSFFAGGAYQHATGVYFDTVPSGAGCDLVVITELTTLQIAYDTLLVSMCEGDSVFAGGSYQQSSGNYYDTLVAANGCDSILTTMVSVFDTFITNVDASVCAGDSFYAGGGWQSSAGIYFDTLTNRFNCDSIIITNLAVRNNSAATINISICEGDSAYAGGAYQHFSGNYLDTFVAANGCDSVLTTILTVLDTSVTNVSESICQGDSFYAGGGWQSSAGIYFDTLTNRFNCDSIIITNLAVRNNSAATINISICEGDSAYAGGAYQHFSGNYMDTFVAANGCDSVLTTILTMLLADTTRLRVSICNGDSYFVGGAWQTASGIYYDTLVNLSGCDSIIITTLDVISVSVDAGSDVAICQGQSTQLNASGALTYTWSPAPDLDNPYIANPNASPTVTTTYFVTSFAEGGGNLIVNGDFSTGNTGFTSAYSYQPPPNSAEGQYWISSNSQAWNGNMASCSDHTTGTGDFMMVNGNTAAAAQVWCQTVNVIPGADYAFSTWIQTLHTSNPADLQFSINGSLIGSLLSASPNTCVWERFYAIWNSGLSTTANICIVNQNTAFLGNDFGLDDISFAPLCTALDSVTVTVKPNYTVDADVSICQGNTHTLPDGSVVSSPGTYPVVLAASNGCDSVVITNLTVVSSFLIQNDVTICQDDSFYAGGAYQGTSGAYLDTFPSSGGCDSIVLTILTVEDTFRLIFNESICEGDSFFAGGTWQKSSGIYYDSLSTLSGCDSIIVTDLHVVPTVYGQFDTIICEGESIFAGGALQDSSGIYLDTAISLTTGCDSIHTTYLTVAEIYSIDRNRRICEGDSFYVAGGWQKVAGDYLDYYTTSYGCDSLIITHLAVDTVIRTSLTPNICFGESYYAGGAVQTASGTYYDTLTALGGCDSIVTTILTVLDTFIRDVNVPICEGDSFYAGGAWQTTDGVYRDTLASSGGCDSTVITHLAVVRTIYTQIDTTICDGETFYAGGAFQDSSGIYIDRSMASGGCDSINTTNLTVIKLSVSGYNVTVCPGEDTTISVADIFASYLWSPGGETTPSITAIPGAYQLTVWDTNSCDATADFLVSANDSISLAAVPPSDTIIEGESLRIQLVHSSSSTVQNYVWSPAAGLNCSTPICDRVVITPDDDITYTVIATDDIGCRDTIEIPITVDTLLEPLVYVPNAFTPNGDGVNDAFLIYGQGFEDFHLLVFNRWGEKLFETHDRNAGWDGTYRGKLCNPGVYVYYVATRFIRNEKVTGFEKYKKGSVTLIR